SDGPYRVVDVYVDNCRMRSENTEDAIFEIPFSDEFNGAFWDKDAPNSSEGTRRAIYFSPRRVGGYSDAQATRWALDQFLLEKTIDGKTDPRLDATFIYNKPPEVDGTRTWWGLTYDQLAEGNPNEIW